MSKIILNRKTAMLHHIRVSLKRKIRLYWYNSPQQNILDIFRILFRKSPQRVMYFGGWQSFGKQYTTGLDYTQYWVGVPLLRAMSVSFKHQLLRRKSVHKTFFFSPSSMQRDLGNKCPCYWFKCDFRTSQPFKSRLGKIQNNWVQRHWGNVCTYNGFCPCLTTHTSSCRLDIELTRRFIHFFVYKGDFF